MAGQLVALIVATSFAAGLNVYATVATLGLLARADLVSLPQSLDPISTWPVIAAALALYAVEFVADKIPAIDLVWNALQTFIRVPVAALLGYAATVQLSPRDQLLSAALASVVAMAAHSSKMTARLAVTPSPEPFSNMALSFGEDAIAVFLTWLATRHPLIAAALTVVFLAIIIALIGTIVRGVRALFRGAQRQIEHRPPALTPSGSASRS